MSYRLLILNPGSTSTKAAVYDDDRQVAMKSIVHTNQDLAPYPTLYDQLDYRVALVRGWLGQEGIDLSTLSAVVGRGGIIPNIVAGGYVVDDNLVEVYINDGEYVISNAVYGIGKTITLNSGKTVRLYTMREEDEGQQGEE